MGAMERRDRYRGCLLGLAVGDAIGTTIEFQPRGSFAPLTDLVGGGPFGHGLEIGKIRAGAKRPAGPGQHDQRNVAIGVSPRQSANQAIHERPIERVELVRTVQRQQLDRTLAR